MKSMLPKQILSIHARHIQQTENFIGRVQQSVCNDFLAAESNKDVPSNFITILYDLQLPLEIYESTFKVNLIKLASLTKDTVQTATLLTKLKDVDDRFLSPDLPLFNELDRVRQLYIGVVDSVYCLLNRCPSQKAMENFVKRYFLYALMDKLEDVFKFHTAYCVCELTTISELPKRPDFILNNEISGGIIGGWIRRYLKSVKISSQRKIQLAMSLQNAKRAAKEISIDKQENSVIDHQNNMIGKGYSPEPGTEWMLHKTIEKVKVLTTKYYPKNLDNEIPVWRTPSYKACYENSSTNGGASKYFSKFTTKANTEYWRQHGYDHEPNFLSFTEKWTPKTIRLYEELSMKAYHYGDISYKDNVPLYSFGFSINEIREQLNNNVIRRMLSGEPVKCNYSTVLEPFKVRGVTSGEAEIYQMARLVQPVLHSQLRNSKGPFRFIGLRHNDNDINTVYDGTVLWNEDVFNRIATEEYTKCFNSNLVRNMFTFIVAGDYKNATDNMHPKLPSTFINTLKENKSFSDLCINVLEQTLYGHQISYEKVCNKNTGLFFGTENTKGFKPLVQQEWGQLMGSPTSFPVLNIVNAAMLWASSEIYENRPLTWKELLRKYRPLFNGDDISFLSNHYHYNTWALLCASCGLSLSPGKNYCSTEFVNINSTNYFAEDIVTYEDGSIRLGQFKEMFVVNPGLIKGQSKVLGGTGMFVNSLGSTCDQLEECVRVANDNEKARCYEVFEYHMSDKLKKSRRPWTLPRLFGGLGLPFGEKPTLIQYLVAHNQFNKYKDLTDDSIQKDNDCMAIRYLNQILKNTGIEVSKPTLVRNDVKTNLQNQTDTESETLYETPSLTTSFLSTQERDTTIRAAKSVLYDKKSQNFYLYNKIFELPDGKKKEALKKKLTFNLKKVGEGLTEIEARRLGHSLQAERTYSKELWRMNKLVKSLNYGNVIKVPDDYLEYFKGWTLSTGGLSAELRIDVSKTLEVYN